MQRTKHSFIKNAKERKNVAFFWKEHMPNPGHKSFNNCFLLFYFYVSLHSHKTFNNCFLLFQFYSMYPSTLTRDSIIVSYCFSSMYHSSVTRLSRASSWKLMHWTFTMLRNFEIKKDNLKLFIVIIIINI